jgi:FkbM family methyltransferase
MRQKDLGRILRSHSLTARALTEFRVWQMGRQTLFADLAHCVRLAEAGSTAVDVGASVGNYALALRKAVGRGGRVLALEPNPAVYKELTRSTWGADVDARNLAASSANGTTELLIPVDGAGRAEEPIASLEDRGQACTRVKVQRARLDDLLRDVHHVSVIKIDVEGHEADVIRGADEVLERHRPGLVIEIEQQHQTGNRHVRDVVALLTRRNYECYGIHGEMLIPWAGFDVQRWQTAWLAAEKSYRNLHKTDYVNNFLFIHESREQYLPARWTSSSSSSLKTNSIRSAPA